MAVFAIVIMTVGCAAVLACSDESDVNAADTKVDKTVYVLEGKTVDLAIKTTETALGGDYSTSVKWDVAGDKNSQTKIKNGTVDIASVYVTKGTENGSYVLKFTGTNVGSFYDFAIKYTVDTKVDQGDTTSLVQTITYNVDVHVLPATFKATISYSFTNHTAVSNDGVAVTYTGSIINSNDYYFYAIGLPSGLSMNTNGKIYGTPNIDDTQFVDSSTEPFKVKIIATHKASNIAIATEITLNVTGNPYDFSYAVNGKAIKVSDGVYKVIRGQEFNIATDIGAYDGDHESVNKVYFINEEGDQTAVNANSNGVYVFDNETIGTGSYTVVMINGDVEKSFEVVVVEPLADVVADIGFFPGSGVTITS